MNFPRIPVWALPWRARREIERLNARLAAAATEAKPTPAVEIPELTDIKAKCAKQEKGIAVLLAWIYATHKIDQVKADQTGLTDILKEFPRQ